MKQDTPTIGLVMKSLQAEFFRTMQKGAEEYAARERSFRLLSTGTDTQTEVEKQITLIDELVEKGVDALVVVPIDSRALVEPVVRAVRKGVTVVNIDIRLDEEMLRSAGVCLDYVGPDNFSATRAVGQEVAARLHRGDKVILIEGLPAAENAQRRKAGFELTITDAGLNLVAHAPANWETATAEEVFARLYAGHTDVKAVFCCNDAMALGVIRVLKAQGRRPGEVLIAGFDNDAAMQPLLDEGWLTATVDTFGSRMAVQGIEYALQILHGKPAGGLHSTPYQLIKRG